VLVRAARVLKLTFGNGVVAHWPMFHAVNNKTASVWLDCAAWHLPKHTLHGCLLTCSDGTRVKAMAVKRIVGQIKEVMMYKTDIDVAIR
jgi:hypothetical protein